MKVIEVISTGEIPDHTLRAVRKDVFKMDPRLCGDGICV